MLKRSSDSLKRWPARFALSAVVAVAAATCARPRTASVGTPVARLDKEPEIGIGLVINAPRATIAVQSQVSAVSGGQPVFQLSAGQTITLQPDGPALRVSGGPLPGRYENLNFVSLDPDRFVLVNGKPYRGIASAYIRGGGLYVVNRIGVDAYLQGVVSREMGRRGPQELAALRAQAVVSRTYALANRGRFSAQGFDLGSDVADQAYAGVEGETDQGNAAVRATRGVLLAYRGKPIRAFFHSTCGYATAAPEEAFRQIGSEPYLRSVSDRSPGGGYYCDIAPRFRWQVEWDADSLARILRRTMLPLANGERFEAIQDLRVARTGPSGRVVELKVVTASGDFAITSPDIRPVLRTPAGDPLGSTAFQVRSSQKKGRTVFTAAGAGWGHGVGLCQWGAVGRARAGQSYQAIVSAYFPGAELEQWY